MAILISHSISFAIQTEVKDKEGSYILIMGTVGGVELTIMNIYAPNEDDPIFFKEMASVMAREARGTIILGGDFNCVLNVKLDKLPSNYRPLSRESKAAKHMLEELGFVDVWRAKNPTTKDFTFLWVIFKNGSDLHFKTEPV